MSLTKLIEALQILKTVYGELPVVINSDEFETISSVKIVDDTYRQQDGSLVKGRHILVT